MFNKIRLFFHAKRGRNNLFFRSVFKILDYLRSSDVLSKIKIDFYYFIKSYPIGNYFERKRKILLLKNIHKGERCFILGSGPSVLKQNLSVLKDEFLIAVNQSYLITVSNYDFSPQFVCVSDSNLYKKIKLDLMKLDSTIIFTTGIDGKIGLDYDSNNLASIVRLNPLKKVWNGNFSAYLDKHINKSHTVIIDIAIPLAIYMGFENIYLIGCDNEATGYSYSSIKSHKLTPQIILPEVFKAYETVRSFCDEKSVNIYNAGLGGKLEAFERVSFNNLF